MSISSITQSSPQKLPSAAQNPSAAPSAATRQNQPEKEELREKSEAKDDGKLDNVELSAAARQMNAQPGADRPSDAGEKEKVERTTTTTTTTHSGKPEKKYDKLDTNKDGIVSAVERAAAPPDLAAPQLNAAAAGENE